MDTNLVAQGIDFKKLVNFAANFDVESQFLPTLNCVKSPLGFTVQISSLGSPIFGFAVSSIGLVIAAFNQVSLEPVVIPSPMKPSDLKSMGIFLRNLKNEEVEELFSVLLKEMRRRDSDHFKNDLLANTKALWTLKAQK